VVSGLDYQSNIANNLDPTPSSHRSQREATRFGPLGLFFWTEILLLLPSVVY